MSSFSASGVYSKENDLSLTVSPASTSNGGLVGFMKKGRVGVNLVTSIANFEKQYGKLDFSCTAGYSARAFLSQSSKLYFNRVVSSDMPPCFGALKFQYREVPKPVPPTLSINPPIEILTFGTVDVGKDKIQNFIITNTGDSELRFTVNNINTDTNGVFVFDETQTEITDKEEDLLKLKEFLSTLKTVDKIEILPYHDLGKFKWKNLGQAYPLEGVRTATNEDVEKAKKILEI